MVSGFHKQTAGQRHPREPFEQLWQTAKAGENYCRARSASESAFLNVYKGNLVSCSVCEMEVKAIHVGVQILDAHWLIVSRQAALKER